MCCDTIRDTYIFIGFLWFTKSLKETMYLRIKHRKIIKQMKGHVDTKTKFTSSMLKIISLTNVIYIK